jgi:2,4-dienoyl-CoA reductase-like NADH-dependent reductase (Old Yellow Enzyme family)
MSELFRPFTIGQVDFRNRIVMSPMCMYSGKDGFANDFHLVHYGSRATGGTGLVILEATAVTPEGRISPFDLGIWRDEQIPGLKRIAESIESSGAVAGIQLAHAGRKASHNKPSAGGKPLSEKEGAWQTLAPVPVPFSDETPLPAKLTIKDIQGIIQAFEDAAIRVLKAGFRVIEIHAAHGYLLHEFLSPVSNTRNDRYGGSFENRIRIVKETAEMVRSVWPQKYPLFVRISATDWIQGGWSIEDSVKLSAGLKSVGVDLIDCSSGGIIPGVHIPVAPGYQVEFAERIRSEARIHTGAVGLITSAAQAEEIIFSGKADMVLIARELLRNPYFPIQAARELGVDINWPEQYQRAKW